MKDISWTPYYHLETIAARRAYLSKTFGDEKRKINNRLFVVKPLNKDDNTLSYWEKKKQQSRNFLKNTLRHILLPFPITWSHKNTDRLVQKNVVSIEDYMMGNYFHKDHISALRTGAPQYRSMLIGAATFIAGGMAGSVFTLGVLPATIICAVGLSFVAYSLYGAFRASRKTSLQVGFLKSRMSSARNNETIEPKFVKTYDFVSMLETQRLYLDKKENSPKIALELIKQAINEKMPSEKDKDLFLNKITKEPVENFITKTSNLAIETTDEALLDNIKEELDVLINNIQEVNIKEKYQEFEEDLPTKLNTIREELNKKEDAHLNPILITLDALEVLDNSNNQIWSRDIYKKHIEATDLTAEDKQYLMDKLGGSKELNLADPLTEARILEMKKIIEDTTLQSTPDMPITDHSSNIYPEVVSGIERETAGDPTLRRITSSSQVELKNTDGQGIDYSANNPPTTTDHSCPTYRTENLDSDRGTTTRATVSLCSSAETTSTHEVNSGELSAFPQTPLTALSLKADNKRYRPNCPAPPPSWELLLSSNRSTNIDPSESISSTASFLTCAASTSLQSTNEFDGTPAYSINKSIYGSTSKTYSNLSRLSPELLEKHDRLFNKRWKVPRVVHAAGYKLTQTSPDSFLVKRIP